MRLTVRIGLVSSAWLTTAVMAHAEELTVTTYYPSPRGVYKELRTTEDTFLATQGGQVGIGTVSPGSTLSVAGGAAIGLTYADGPAAADGTAL